MQCRGSVRERLKIKIARRTIGAKGCKINESIIRFRKFNYSLLEIRIQFQFIKNGFISVYLS